MERWPKYTSWFWERAPFFRITMAFCVGVVQYRFFPVSLHFAFWVLLVGALCALLAVFLDLSRSVIRDSLFNVGYLLGFWSVGYLLCFNYDVRNDKLFVGRQVSEGATYIVALKAEPEVKEHSFKLKADVCGIYRNGEVFKATGKVFLYAGNEQFPPVYHSGDTIMVTCNLEPIQNRKNPGEFDYAGFCNANNIFYSAFCSGNDIHLVARQSSKAVSWMQRLHNWSYNQLDEFIPDSTARGLLQAMILGDEVNLDPELRDNYSKAGIVHVIAISGGNILMFFTGISALLVFIRHRKHRWVKFLIALPLVWIYIIVAGLPASGVRAAIMFTFWAIGEMSEQPKNQFNQLMGAAFCLLVAQPMWLFSMGFQLSFVAVLSLLIFYEPIHEKLRFKWKISKFLWSVVAATLAAEILAAPIVIYYFHQFPVSFLITNVVAIIVMQGVLYMGFGILLVSGVVLLPEGIGWILGKAVTLLNLFIAYLGHWQPGALSRLYLSTYEMVLVYIAIAALGYFILRQAKNAVYLGLLAVLVFLISVNVGAYKNAGQELMIVYNTQNVPYYELAYGHEFTASKVDSVYQKAINRATEPVHIMRGIHQKMKKDPGSAFLVNYQRVMIVDGTVDTNAKLPVGFVVYTGHQFPDIVAIQKTLTPQLIIVGAPFTITQQRELQKTARANHIYLHCTGIEGAFVLE